MKQRCKIRAMLCYAMLRSHEKLIRVYESKLVPPFQVAVVGYLEKPHFMSGHASCQLRSPLRISPGSQSLRQEPMIGEIIRFIASCGSGCPYPLAQ